MVLNVTKSNEIRLLALDEFDATGFIGFSDSLVNEISSAVVLTAEYLRKAIDSSLKDTGAYTNDFEVTLGLTEAVGEDVAKIGLYTDLAGNTLEISKLLPTVVSKTADNEITIVYQIATSVEDLT